METFWYRLSQVILENGRKIRVGIVVIYKSDSVITQCIQQRYEGLKIQRMHEQCVANTNFVFDSLQ